MELLEFEELLLELADLFEEPCADCAEPFGRTQGADDSEPDAQPADFFCFPFAFPVALDALFGLLFPAALAFGFVDCWEV